MDNNYTVLNQDSLKRRGRRIWIICIALLIIGITFMTIADLHSTPQSFSLPNGMSLIVEDEACYLDGIEITPTKLSVIENIRGWIKANSNFSTFPLFILGVSCYIGCLVLLIKANPSINSLRLLIPQRFLQKHRMPITNNLDISNAPAGIIAVRAWVITKDGMLKSTGRGVVWQNLKTKADIKPEHNNVSGIYAYRLGTHLDDYDFALFETRVWGIVSLTGHCVGHTDYLVRATACTTLSLIVKREMDADKLRLHYDCPILVSSNPTKTIQDWILSHQGIYWLQHNEQLIHHPIEDKFTKDIDEILVAKNV